MTNYIIYREGDELYHHGVKGMKWGVRKAQENTLTKTGRNNYRSRIESEYNNSNDKKSYIRKETGNVIKGAAYRYAKRAVVTFGIGVGLGAISVAFPATAPVTSVLAASTDIVAYGHRIANLVDTGIKLSEVHRLQAKNGGQSNASYSLSHA